jgi:hypothetical protein
MREGGVYYGAHGMTPHGEGPIDILTREVAEIGSTVASAITLIESLSARVTILSMGENVRSYGAVGDGVTDDTAAIQAAIDACPHQGTVYFPIGAYRITATLEPGLKIVHLQGESEGFAFSYPFESGGGTIILGAFAGPLFRNMTGGQGPVIEKLAFLNNHLEGDCIQIADVGFGGVVGGTIRNCSIFALRYGVRIHGSFSFLVQQCNIHSAGNHAGSVGVYSPGHTTIDNCDITFWDHGARLCGMGVQVKGCRFEVNKVGIMAGFDLAGSNEQLAGADISAHWFEGNDTALWLNHVASTSVHGISIHGSHGAPSGLSHYGVRCGDLSCVEVGAALVAGEGYDVAALAFASPPILTTFKSVAASNALGTGWVLPADQSGITFIQCNQP